MEGTAVFRSRSLRIVNGALVTLAIVPAMAGACGPGAPSVDRATIWFDTVKRGDFVRTVRGPGTLQETDAGGWVATLRVPESQSFDLAVGQRALIDIRDTDVEGQVAELAETIEQGTLAVRVELLGDVPQGARPRLSIDGRVELETIPDVLYLGKPAYGQANSTVALFKVVDDGRGEAVRVPVEFGPSSVNLIVVESGLEEGDEIILSDMSRWDTVDRVILR